MTGLLRSEWIKLRSVRTTWILAGLALAIEAVFLILVSSLVPADEFGDGTADTLTGMACLTSSPRRCFGSGSPRCRS